MRRLLSLLLVALAAGLVAGPAAAQRPHMTRVGIEDGLPQSQPLALEEDRQGYLWVGTYGGAIARFDGLHFETITGPGLPAGSETHAIVEDAHGTIWVGTGRGLWRFDGQELQAWPLGDGPLEVRALAATPDGALWVGTRGEGLFRLAPGDSTRHWTREAGAPGRTIVALIPQGEDGVWAGGAEGARRFGPDGPGEGIPTDGLQAYAFTAFAPGGPGELWIGSTHGLLRWSGGEPRPAGGGLPPDLAIHCLRRRGDGSLWVGTDEGLYSITPAGNVAHLGRPEGVTPGNIWALEEDREGQLWIGTDGDGLLGLGDNAFTVLDESHGLVDASAWAFAQDARGRVWIATDTGGVAILGEDGPRHLRRADGLAEDTAYALLASGDGGMWIGSPRGLSFHHPDRGTRVVGGEEDGLAEISALERGPDGSTWVATMGYGLWRLGEGGEREQFAMPSGLPTDVCYGLASDGERLWIATPEGLASWDPERGIRRHGRPVAATGHSLGRLLPDGRGGLWAGSYGGGLWHLPDPFDPGLDSPPPRHIGAAEGLLNGQVCALVRDGGGNLWISTNRGLYRLAAREFLDGGAPRLTRFGAPEGFAGEEANDGAALLDRDGQLWFGTVAGVVRMDPALATPRTREPLVHLRRVELAYGTQSWEDFAAGRSADGALPVGLVLPHDRNHLSFGFAGISLGAPGNILYRHRLVGLDPGWTPVTADDRATYGGLAPGRYRLELQARVGDGPWTAAAPFEFRVSPPLWQRPWALAGLLCLGLGALVGWWYQHERQHRVRRAELAHRVAERTDQLRQQTDQLAEKNARLRELMAVIQKSDNSVLITDTTGRIEWVSDGFTRLTGYTIQLLGEELGGTIQEISTHGPLPEAIRRSVEDGQSYQYESSVVHRATGQAHWFRSTLTPICDEAGHVRKLVVIDVDITDRRELEDQLIAATEEAEAAAQAKSEFLANMSHEIRTPMNGVIGMTGLLLETELDDEQSEYASVIQSCSDSLLGIIDDILDLSKIEAGHLELDVAPHDLHRVIEDAAAQVAGRAEAKGLDLVVDLLGSAPAAVLIDGMRLRQILLNFLSNAVKFTERGEVVVAAMEQGGRLRIEVRDQGIGIPADRIEQVFSEFTQADSSTTRRYGGTGLGLAISRRLARLMGGEVGASSQEGRGSTFWVEIPATPCEAPGAGRVSPAPGEFDGRRAIVVEPGGARREALARRLRAWGLEATAVEDKFAARALLASGDRPGTVVLAEPAVLEDLGCHEAGSARSIALVPLGQLKHVDGGAPWPHVPTPVRLEPLLRALRQASPSLA